MRLYPSEADTQLLRRWFGAVRWTYNAALERIKAGKADKKNLFWLRNRFVNKANIPNSRAWLHECCPKHVREGAIKDLGDA